MVEEFPLATEDWRLSTGQTYKHPRAGARGRFGAPHTRRKPGLMLRGVLGGDPLMPMKLKGVVIVSCPDISPETHRLGLRRATPNHYPQRFRLGHDESPSGHGPLLTRGEPRPAVKHRLCRTECVRMSKPALNFGCQLGGFAVSLRRRREARSCPQDTAWRESV